jgi:DNA-binding SARP family transcriptional activator
LGVVLRSRGDYKRALELFAESLDLSQTIGETARVAYALRQLGFLAQRQGYLDRALVYLEEALALFQGMQRLSGVAYCLASISGVARQQRQWTLAGRLCGAAERLFETAKVHIPAIDQRDYVQHLADLQAVMGDRALRLAQAEGHRLTVEQALEVAGQVLCQAMPGLPEPVAITVPSVQSSQPDSRIVALAPGQVYRQDHALTARDWTYVKAQELFWYLLLAPAPQSRGQIALACWPDTAPAQLRSLFHDTLYRLRRALGLSGWIVYADRQYRFNRDMSYWCDIERFETSLVMARQTVETDPEQAMALLSAASDLYQGDLLTAVTLGDWILPRREAASRQYQEALETLGSLQMRAARYADAVHTYRRLIAHDVYLEAAHRTLMRYYAQQGERSQALRHYQELVERLHAELGVPPAPETITVYEQLRQDEAE